LTTPAAAATIKNVADPTLPDRPWPQ